MRFKLLSVPIIIFFSLVGFKSNPEGIYALVKTTQGSFTINLYYKQAPMTVANFIGLAEGTIKNSHKDLHQPFYDGIVFHRLVSGKIIQTGDPKANGEGGPGYKFKDEFHSSLKHDQKGIVSMANYGKNTNGSQFFICFKSLPTLDGVHTVFGIVSEGMEVVESLKKGDKIENIKILRVGQEAENFSVNQHFDEKHRKYFKQ